MSKKLEKRLKKFMKQRRSIPKRIAGVKIPKRVRRAADTPLGAEIMAELLVAAGAAALTTPAVTRLRQRAQQTVMLGAHMLSQAANDISSSVTDAFAKEEEKPRRKKGRSTNGATATH